MRPDLLRLYLTHFTGWLGDEKGYGLDRLNTLSAVDLRGCPGDSAVAAGAGADAMKDVLWLLVVLLYPVWVLLGVLYIFYCIGCIFLYAGLWMVDIAWDRIRGRKYTIQNLPGV